MRLLVLSAVVAGLAYLVGLPAPASLAAKAWPALAMAAVLAPRRTPFARTIALGLVLSAVGDVVLDLPDAFILGLVAFLCAHVTYIVAFARDERRLAWPWAVGPYLYGAGVVASIGPGRIGALIVPVGLYVLAITTMVWRAAARLPRPGAVAAALGALSFAVSDTILALHLFAAVDFPGRDLAVMLTYWGAQALITTSAWAASRAASTPHPRAA